VRAGGALALAVLLAGGTPSAVQALVLCAAHSGAVRARPSCRKKEQLLDRAALGLVGAAAEGTPGPGVRIRDHSGGFYGSNLLPGPMNPGSVLVPAGSFFVAVSPDGLAVPESAYFSYEQPGCKGQRYYGSDPDVMVRVASATNPPYYAGDPIGSHVQASYEYTSYDPTLCASQSGTVIGTSCCFTGSGMTNDFLGPAIAVDVSAVALPLDVVVTP
jgi:hypothetical protein